MTTRDASRGVIPLAPTARASTASGLAEKSRAERSGLCKISSMKTQVTQGDNVKTLSKLPDDCLDAIVTDPPYGLSFMGKDWDKALPDPKIWVECLRVLKPGGHMVAFGAPRLYHRLACQIEDAGWELRDSLMWIFSTGFPKSLDISKALDKAAGAERTESGWHDRYHDGRTRTESEGCPANNVATLRTHNGNTRALPASDLAKQWEGWGTALKPSYEPIVCAQKPFTVVPLSVISDVEPLLSVLLCLSLSSAKPVNSLLLSNQNESSGASVFALWAVDAFRGKSSGDSSGAMGMFKSPETAKTILSIAESWRTILDVIYSPPSMFTTSTMTDLTIALRTCGSLISQIMQDCITQDVMTRLGRLLSASTAVSSSSDSDRKSNRETSVHELASLLMELKRVPNVEASITLAARLANSALQDAITKIVATSGSLKPSYEPILLCRKPLEGTVAANVTKHGVGGINVDACRIEPDGKTLRAPKSIPNNRTGVVGSDLRISNVSAARMAAAQAESIDRTNTLGRWPANLILDEQAGAMLDAQSAPNMHSAGVARSGSSNPRATVPDITSYSPHGSSASTGDMHRFGDKGGASRFFYCPKASRAEREAGLSGYATFGPDVLVERDPDSAGAQNPRAGAGRQGEGRANVHATVKPVALMRWLCRLICPPGGTILDPFLGSGSTGCAAAAEDFEFLGLEMIEEYCTIARARIRHAIRERRKVTHPETGPKVGWGFRSVSR